MSASRPSVRLSAAGPVLRPACLLALLLAPWFAAPAHSADHLDQVVVEGDLGTRLDALAGRYGDWGFAGTVLVVEGDRVLLHKGYGLADQAHGVANSIATRHPYLSITKPILATAVLRLAERGVLDLDAPLSTYLGPFPEEKAGATLHHLLTHTAGLAARGSDVGRPERGDFVQAMKEAPFESAPGAERRYSNAGYSLVAAVVEEVTGQSWQGVVRQEIFAPAGMRESAFATDAAAPRTAIGYAGRVPPLRPMTLADGPPAMAELWWGAAGAAGIDGTVADLYRWFRALVSDGLLEEGSVARIFTTHIGDQGYGWHIDTTEAGSRRRWKGGGLPMYESKIAWYPERDLVIVFAINNHQGWRVPLWSGLEAILFGGEIALPPAPAPEVEGPAPGTYRLVGGGEVTLAAAGSWTRIIAADEAAAAALGFDGDARAAGAVVAARPLADGRLGAAIPRPGRAALRWVAVEPAAPEPDALGAAAMLRVEADSPSVDD